MEDFSTSQLRLFDDTFSVVSLVEMTKVSNESAFAVFQEPLS